MSGLTIDYLAQSAVLHTGSAYASDRAVDTSIHRVGTVETPSGVLALGDITWEDMALMRQVRVPVGTHEVLVSRFELTYGNGATGWINATTTVLINPSNDRTDSSGEALARNYLTDGRERSGIREGDVIGAWRRDPSDGLHTIGIERGICTFIDAATAAKAVEAVAATRKRTGIEQVPVWDDPDTFDEGPLALPDSSPGVNVTAGMGDGGYTCFADYAPDGTLTAIHINFHIVTRDDLSGIAATGT